MARWWRNRFSHKSRADLAPRVDLLRAASVDLARLSDSFPDVDEPPPEDMTWPEYLECLTLRRDHLQAEHDQLRYDIRQILTFQRFKP